MRVQAGLDLSTRPKHKTQKAEQMVELCIRRELKYCHSSSQDKMMIKRRLIALITLDHACTAGRKICIQRQKLITRQAFQVKGLSPLIVE